MEIQITKERFDAALPAGAACTDEVFDSCKAYIEEAVENCVENYLGQIGETALDGNESLLSVVEKFCCVSGFLSVFRQLDLVLTPTGFGVVSTNEVAPASASRVDGLEKQLRTRLYRLEAKLLHRLRLVDGWGDSEQAKQRLDKLYGVVDFFNELQHTYEDWERIADSFDEYDFIVREKISDEQMEQFLEIYRRGECNEVMLCLRRAFANFLQDSSESKSVAHKMLQRALYLMELHPEDYPLYMNSTAYKTNHAETYQNTRNATGFIFQG